MSCSHPLKHASSPVLRSQALNLSGRRCLLRTGKFPRHQRCCITRPSSRGQYQLKMAYSTRWSEALTSDLDRMASRNGLVAVLCGAAAGFAASGLLGAWLATRRQRASTPQPRPLARIAVNDGAFEPPSAPPSNLGSLPVTPRGTDGGYEEDAEVKMVLVVRSDLKMGKGKVAAQCCHATLGQFKKLWKRKDPNLRRWEMSGQTKVCLRVDDEEGLLQLQQAARNADIPVHIVVDAGRTQIAPDSKTVIALGPADSGLIDSVTGHLKLL